MAGLLLGDKIWLRVGVPTHLKDQDWKQLLEPSLYGLYFLHGGNVELAYNFPRNWE